MTTSKWSQQRIDFISIAKLDLRQMHTTYYQCTHLLGFKIEPSAIINFCTHSFFIECRKLTRRHEKIIWNNSLGFVLYAISQLYFVFRVKCLFSPSDVLSGVRLMIQYLREHYNTCNWFAVFNSCSMKFSHQHESLIQK